MTIRWLGQACFILTLLHGTNILIDPPHPAVGYPITAHSIAAEAVFVSHEHSDHNWTDAAKDHPRIVQPIMAPAEEQYGTLPDPGALPPVIDFARIFAYHDNVHGTKRGPDTITIFNVEGLRICHLGDLGELHLTGEQLREIGKVDVLMIPVGGFFTIDAAQAVEIISELKPRVILPMHYQTLALNAQLKADLHPITEFEAAMAGHANIVTVKARDLKLTKATLPKTPTVYILRYE